MALRRYGMARSVYSCSLRYSLLPYCSGRDIGIPAVSSLDQTPCKSGSPHEVRSDPTVIEAYLGAPSAAA